MYKSRKGLNEEIVQSISRDEICFVRSGCFQLGAGVFGGISGIQTANVIVNNSDSVQSDSAGIFISTGSGASAVSSVNAGTTGSIGATRSGIGPGIGFAVGIEFCQSTARCK